MYQRQGSTAFKKDLTNSIALSKHLDFPERKFKSVHVAGTNGKGSTSHMLTSVLMEAGYKVGLYTSPHLKDFKERIRINGTPISSSEVIDFVKRNKSFLEHQKLSFFEMTVGMAFDYFANQKIDVAIVEVGLGGRLDSTNIIQPLVSVITNIGLDHTQFLGDTEAEIAFEKGGIIKSEVPVVVGEKQAKALAVFEKIAFTKKAPIFVAETMISTSYKTDLLGEYQLKNVKTAVQTVKILCEKYLNVSQDQLIDGLNKVVVNTGLKGRWQVLQLNPKVICDTAHNKEGLAMVLHQLKNESYRKLHIVLGMVNDKNLDSILVLFPKKAKYYFCKPDIPRGLDGKLLKEDAIKFGLKGVVYHSVDQAYTAALINANETDLIYVGGSTFVVAEMDL